MKLKTFAVLALASACLAAPAFADKITNKSIIDLTKAKMSEDVIIAAINGGTPDFDTSASGLVALKNAGVSDKVMQAMISAKSAGAAPARASAPAAAPGVTPEVATMVDGGKRSDMRYLTPTIRNTAAPFAGVRTYASLNGRAAALRASASPKFIIFVPNNAQAESYYTLARLAQQKNGNREVLVGGGYMSYSTGITKDRVVACTATKAASQAGAPAGFTAYEIAPNAPLAQGEYALVLYSSVVRSTGYFATGLDSYFDFGVD